MRPDTDLGPTPPTTPEPDRSVAPKTAIRAAIEIAARDPELVDRVEDPRFRRFGKLAGVVRNTWGMLRGADPAKASTERHVCTGIAARAVAVLKAAHARGELPGVTKSSW